MPVPEDCLIQMLTALGSLLTVFAEPVAQNGSIGSSVPRQRREAGGAPVESYTQYPNASVGIQ